MKGGEQSHVAKEILIVHEEMYKSHNSNRSKSANNSEDMKPCQYISNVDKYRIDQRVIHLGKIEVPCSNQCGDFEEEEELLLTLIRQKTLPS